MVGDLFSAADVPEFYVNAARIAHGPYDFVFEFGLVQLADVKSIEPPTSRRVAMLRMSPQHALVLSKILAAQVKAFQALNGKINVSDAIRKQMEAVDE